MGAILMSMSVLTIAFSLLVYLLVNQLIGFFQEWPELKLKLANAAEEISVWLSGNFSIDREKQIQWLNKSLNDSGANAMSIISKTLSASAVGAVFFILIPIYAVLILYYRHKWMEVLYRLFPSEGRERITEIVKLSIQSYYNFIKGMAVVYLIVAILNSTGLFFLGIPHAILFGSIAAILTFIPYVGILVASLLPISMAWITYNSIWYPLGVVAIFAFVQYLDFSVGCKQSFKNQCPGHHRLHFYWRNHLGRFRYDFVHPIFRNPQTSSRPHTLTKNVVNNFRGRKELDLLFYY
jgi:predicted PurR-regulated permease PerM